MSTYRDYWNERYTQEGKIWGDQPSKSALIALKYFETRDLKKILIPGAGYGRDTKVFSENGYNVTGIEISQIALSIAKEFDQKTRFIEQSVLDIQTKDEKYDAIYSLNTLHLFLLEQRVKFLKNCYDLLKEAGYIFMIVFSEEDPSYGKGKEIEPDTFESKPNRPVHYFTEEDLIEQFEDFSIINLGVIKYEENHGEIGKHTHILRYIFAQKK